MSENERFEREVYPIVLRWAWRVLKDPELAHRSTVLAWWLWSHRTADYPPSHWARLAVRHVRNGRDLPGLKRLGRSAGQDALDVAWQGGLMQEVKDGSPGPVALAISRERYEMGFRKLTPHELEIVRRIEAGENRTMSLAKKLGVTAGRISQIRRAAAGKLGG